MKRLIILAVDDDKLNRELVMAAFQEDQHVVYGAASLGESHVLLQRLTPDIIILDRGLPDGDGLQFCLNLKKDPLFRGIPVIMLTGRAEIPDKILGLRYGADDYLAKPFDMEELRARVGALARRAYGGQTPELTLCGITMDLRGRTVTVKNEPLELTNKEFALLRAFMESPGTVLTRESLLATVWNSSEPASYKVVDVTVMNLRRKLGAGESLIRSVRSLGYMFTATEAAPGQNG